MHKIGQGVSSSKRVQKHCISTVVDEIDLFHLMWQSTCSYPRYKYKHVFKTPDPFLNSSAYSTTCLGQKDPESPRSSSWEYLIYLVGTSILPGTLRTTNPVPVELPSGRATMLALLLSANRPLTTSAPRAYHLMVEVGCVYDIEISRNPATWKPHSW